MGETESVKSKEEVLAMAADLLRELNKLQREYPNVARSVEADRYNTLNRLFDDLLKNDRFPVTFWEVTEIVERDEENVLEREGQGLFKELQSEGADAQKLSRLKELCERSEYLSTSIWKQMISHIYRDRERYDPGVYEQYIEHMRDIVKAIFDNERYEDLVFAIENANKLHAERNS